MIRDSWKVLGKARKKGRDPSARCARSGLASWSDARFQNGKKPMPPPVFCERVRKRLKGKNLECKTDYTQNGRVRKGMSQKGLDSVAGLVSFMGYSIVKERMLRAGREQYRCETDPSLERIVTY